MEIAFILIFFLFIVIFGLVRNFKNRSLAENLYYILTIAASFAILLLKSLDLLNFSPIRALSELFEALNLLPRS